MGPPRICHADDIAEDDDMVDYREGVKEENAEGEDYDNKPQPRSTATSATPTPIQRPHNLKAVPTTSARPQLPLRTAKKQPKSTGYSADREKSLRRARFATDYKAFVRAAELRKMNRHDFETRNKIWSEALDKAQARLASIEKEKEELSQKIEIMVAARTQYNAANVVDVDLEADVGTMERWRAFFELDTDDLEM